MSLEIFSEKVAERLLASPGTEMQVQGQTSSPAGRLVGRLFLYRNPATHAKEGTPQRPCRVSREKQTSDRENYKEVHYNVLQKMRCRTVDRTVF